MQVANLAADVTEEQLRTLLGDAGLPVARVDFETKDDKQTAYVRLVPPTLPWKAREAAAAAAAEAPAAAAAAGEGEQKAEGEKAEEEPTVPGYGVLDGKHEGVQEGDAYKLAQGTAAALQGKDLKLGEAAVTVEAPNLQVRNKPGQREW
jgi:hypothetical protein